MAIGTFTLTGNLTTYANLEKAAGYGSLIIRAIPDSMPVPAELETLVQPDPFPIASDGTFSIELDAVAGVKYRVSTSPRSLFPSFAFDALAAGETVDISEVQTVPASTPTVPYLIGRGVPAGGTTGQVAAKASDADYDVEWVDQTGGGGGGGAVDSVNGQTGVVVLGASDVGAQVAGSYATAAQGALADTAVQPAALTSLVDTTDPRLSDARTPTAHTHPASQVSDSTTVGRALLTAADAAAARTAIGAGTSSLALGTTGSTAAAGNDSRLSDARTPTAHAASHASAGSDPLTLAESQVTGLVADLAAKALNTVTITAGTGLTGGGDLTANRTLAVAYGTTSTTAAVGNDARITGAAQKASNLSDLANAGTARTNLGLGGAATLAVGTTAGTVAAGDHLHDARYPVVVVHGTTAGTARPSGATVVLWVGTVAPTNAIAGDQWDDSGAVVVNYINEPTSEGTSGQVLTTNGAGVRTWTTVSGGSDPWTYVVATADTSNSTTTAANITGMSVTGLANGLYAFEFYYNGVSAAGTTGIQIGVSWAGTTGLTPRLATFGIDGNSMRTNTHTAAATSLTALSAAAPGNGTDERNAGTITGTIRVASMTGTIYATVTSEIAASQVTIKADSYIRYRKIAN